MANTPPTFPRSLLMKHGSVSEKLADEEVSSPLLAPLDLAKDHLVLTGLATKLPYLL